jgi:hypothetical protein
MRLLGALRRQDSSMSSWTRSKCGSSVTSGNDSANRRASVMWALTLQGYARPERSNRGDAAASGRR